MNIKRKILVPAIAMITISCVAVLVSSILLFNMELSNSIYTKVNTAMRVMEHEINEMKRKAEIAAFAMAKNQDLIDVLADNSNGNKIVDLAAILYSLTQVDYCTILDAGGNVLTRTHAPDIYGDSLAHLPHVKKAQEGISDSYVAHGVTILLGAYAGAPIYDSDMNMIGIISLGYRLDTQAFASRMKEMTGCEVTIFFNDERVSSTVLNEDGTYALGTKADTDISRKVLSGEKSTESVRIFGKDMLASYSPLYGMDDEIIGMMSVAYHTEEDMGKIIFFILSGALITLVVLAVSFFSANFVSNGIERRLKNMMNEIREANEHAQLMIDMSPLGINLIDENFNIIDCNARALAMFGFNSSKKQAYIPQFYTFSPEYQPNGQASAVLSKQYIKKAFEEGYFRCEEWEHFTPNGETLPCEVTLVRSVYKNKQVILAYMHDLRELKTVIANLRQADEYTQLLFNAMPLSCTLWNRNFEMINCNQETLKLFEVEDRRHFYENYTEYWAEFQPDGENSLETGYDLIKNAFDTTFSRIEWMHKLPHGELLPAEITLVRVKYKDDYLVAGYIRDLREHKKHLAEIEKTQESLRHARDAAQAANKTKSIFLANMSHEIRTPMNSIMGFAELAQYGEIPDKTREYLSNITESAGWLLKIINDILDISKIESGKIVLEQIPFDLHDILAHCQSAIISKTEEKGISLYFYAEPSIGGKLLGDPVRLRQALMNLLSNGVKFTNIGTVKLLVSVVKFGGNDNITIRFEIKDSGIGMSPEQIAKIFDPFVQADNSVTRRFGGTGLGLSITKNIIELMGGTLTVVSTEGIGSKFSFELTFDRAPDNVQWFSIQESAFDVFEKPNFTGEILVCEDNSLNQQVICDHLARVGLKTVVAHNGKEGVDIVAKRIKNNEKPFDLIFMDIHMPVMDGLEAAEKLAKIGAKSPIVAITANVMSNDLELYKLSGMTDCVGKPFTSQELWKCLLKHLPVVNFTSADKNLLSAKDEKLKDKLKINFVKNNQETYSEFIKSLESGDVKSAHRIAHTLKSSAGQIGEKRLQAAAAAAEAMLSAGNGENLLSGSGKKELSILEAELKSVLCGLAPLLTKIKIETESGNNNKSEITGSEKILGLFEKLGTLLASNNTECLNLLDDIRAVPGTEKLSYQIEEYNFKQAAETLEKLTREINP